MHSVPPRTLASVTCPAIEIFLASSAASFPVNVATTVLLPRFLTQLVSFVSADLRLGCNLLLFFGSSSGLHSRFGWSFDSLGLVNGPLVCIR